MGLWPIRPRSGQPEAQREGGAKRARGSEAPSGRDGILGTWTRPMNGPLAWCKEEIGMEIHGTTKRRPYEVFQKEEASCLKPLPAEPYECPQWKSCKVHPDHHVVFRSFLLLLAHPVHRARRSGSEGDRIWFGSFQEEQLIKTHSPRLSLPGTWQTDPFGLSARASWPI